MDKERLFGGNPLGVVVRLVVLSIIVGIVLSALDIRPQDILSSLRLFVTRLFNLGFGAIENAIGFLLLGAVVVIPLWLIARVLGGFTHRDDKRQP